MVRYLPPYTPSIHWWMPQYHGHPHLLSASRSRNFCPIPWTTLNLLVTHSHVLRDLQWECPAISPSKIYRSLEQILYRKHKIGIESNSSEAVVFICTFINLASLVPFSETFLSYFCDSLSRRNILKMCSLVECVLTVVAIWNAFYENLPLQFSELD